MHVPRNSCQGGGVGLLHNKCYKMEMQSVASYSSFEYVEILFRLPATVLRIGILYRPPEEERWLSHNPKRFWKYVKSMTKQNTSPNFLRKGQTIITKPSIKANMLNDFFQSVFSPVPVLNTQPTTAPRPSNRLPEIIFNNISSL